MVSSLSSSSLTRSNADAAVIGSLFQNLSFKILFNSYMSLVFATGTRSPGYLSNRALDAMKLLVKKESVEKGLRKSGSKKV